MARTIMFADRFFCCLIVTRAVVSVFASRVKSRVIQFIVIRYRARLTAAIAVYH